MRVAVLGLGIIGKRLAAALAEDPDLELAGVAVRSASPAARAYAGRGVYASEPAGFDALRDDGVPPRGDLADLLAVADLVVDCGPSGTGATRASRYAAAGVDAVFCGGERAPDLGPLVHPALNYEVAATARRVRMVSCNTTALGRVVAAVGPGNTLEMSATVLRCATDNDKAGKGITNGALLGGALSHHAEDLRAILPGLVASSWAAALPMTCGHAILVRLRLATGAGDGLARLRAAPRVTVVENALDTAVLRDAATHTGRRWAQRFELTVLPCETEGDELLCWLSLDNESITIPETMDIIRARSLERHG